MDKQKLIALLQKPEGSKLDFKQQLSIKTDSEKKELAKDVAAIANSKGGRGYILFGIEDKTQRVVGINESNYHEEQLQQIISQRCDPPVAINFNVLYLDKKAVGVLTIYKSNQKPHQLRQTGTFYVRRGSTTDIARREEVASMFQETGLLQYEKMLVHGASFKELDQNLVEGYITKIGISGVEEERLELLESLGIIGRDEDSGRLHPTIGGMLVFGSKPQCYLPHTGIKLINYIDAELNHYFEGPIIKMLNDIEDYLYQKIKSSSYPVAALVEAVANATVHRDYFALGREIVVMISNKKIEVSNPGALSLEDEEVLAFEENNPNRRNPWIYQRLMTMDEKKRFLKTGAGISKIKQSFKLVGEVRFINSTKRNLFKVVLPGFEV